jgi:hypothetical protein
VSDEPEAEGRGDTADVRRGGVEEGSDNESCQEKSEEEVHHHDVDVELVCACYLPPAFLSPSSPSSPLPRQRSRQ